MNITQQYRVTFWRNSLIPNTVVHQFNREELNNYIAGMRTNGFNLDIECLE